MGFKFQLSFSKISKSSEQVPMTPFGASGNLSLPETSQMLLRESLALLHMCCCCKKLLTGVKSTYADIHR